MIGFFPPLYPDELLYSQLCRYYQRTGYTRFVFAADDLYIHRTVRPSVEFVNAFTEDAMKWITRDTAFETVIEQHTMYPAYTRFLPKERRNMAFQALCDRDSRCYNLVGARTPGRPGFLRFCPVCAGEDRKRFGETYWHREHQIPHIDVCPKHKCFLEESRILMAEKMSPGLYGAETEVPSDMAERPCTNDKLIDFTDYVLSVFRLPVDLETDTPPGSFLTSRLDGCYRSKIGIQIKTTQLYEDYRAFIEEFCDPMTRVQMSKAYTNYLADPYKICHLAYFQGIPASDLAHMQDESVPTAIEELYRELSSRYSVPYTVISDIGDEIVKHYRSAGKVSRRSGPKQREWAEIDLQYLPKVKACVDYLRDSEAKPERITVSRVERNVGLRPKQLPKMPKCLAYIQQYEETTHQYHARKLEWAVRLFAKEGKELSTGKLNHFLNFREGDIEGCLMYVTDLKVREIIGRLM